MNRAVMYSFLVFFVLAANTFAFLPQQSSINEFGYSRVQNKAAFSTARNLKQIIETRFHGVSADFDSATGRLHCIEGPITDPSRQSPEEAAVAFVNKNIDLFDNCRLEFDKVVDDGRAVHVHFSQVIDGVRVHNKSVVVHFGKDGAIRMVNSDCVNVDKAVKSPENTLSENEAVSLALENLGAGRENLRGPVSSEKTFLPTADGAVLAWKVLVPASSPLGDWEVLVDAGSGKIMARRNHLVFFTGEGSVYPANPLKGVPELLPLDNMSQPDALAGQYINVKNDDADEASEEDGRYVYDPDNTHFDEAMVYHHLNVIHNFVRNKLGFNELTKSMRATVHYGTDYDNAFYSPWMGGFAFGDGKKLNDLSKEAAVIYHEFTHAVTGKIVSLAYSAESGAMNEGYSDFFGCLLTDDPKLGEWTVQKLDKPWMRNLEDTVHYPEDIAGEVHHDGRIWGCVLWDLKKALGGDIAANVIHKSRYYLSYRAKFVDGLRGCIEADKAMYDGTHVEKIKEVFAGRGIALPAEDAQDGDTMRFHEIFGE